MKNILTFFGKDNENGYLSNWYSSPLKLIFNEQTYQFQNAEQAMMAGKASLFGDGDIFHKIINQPDPKRVKGLGRKVQNFDPAVWDKYKVLIVKSAVKSKFIFNANLKEKLLSTGDAYLAEASPHDKIWGTGSKSKNPKFWKGQNLLGLILMEVRGELR